MKSAEVHQKQKEFLSQEIKLDRLSHAYLLAGEPGVGKKKVVEWFIDQLRLQVDDSWDFQLWQVYPEYPESGGRGTIGIDQMREVKRRTDLRFSGQGKQVVVVHEAQEMNFYAQDALLKVLEEPKNQTIFILLADYLQPLRSTIQSRCQLLYFPPLSFFQSVNWLVRQGLSQEKATMLSLLGQGRLDLMAELKDDPKAVKKKLDEWEKLRELQQKPLYERFRFAEKIAKERGSLSQLLSDWLIYWRAMLLIKSLGLRVDPKWTVDYNLPEIAAIIDQVEEVESSFKRISLNKRLALEQILISFDHV